MHPGSAFVPPPQPLYVPIADPNGARVARRAARSAEPAAPVHPDDVGPLLAVAELLRDQEPIDDATRAQFLDAVNRALTGAASDVRR